MGPLIWVTGQHLRHGVWSAFFLASIHLGPSSPSDWGGPRSLDAIPRPRTPKYSAADPKKASVLCIAPFSVAKRCFVIGCPRIAHFLNFQFFNPLNNLTCFWHCWTILYTSGNPRQYWVLAILGQESWRLWMIYLNRWRRPNHCFAFTRSHKLLPNQN